MKLYIKSTLRQRYPFYVGNVVEWKKKESRTGKKGFHGQIKCRPHTYAFQTQWHHRNNQLRLPVCVTAAIHFIHTFTMRIASPLLSLLLLLFFVTVVDIQRCRRHFSSLICFFVFDFFSFSFLSKKPSRFGVRDCFDNCSLY